MGSAMATRMGKNNRFRLAKQQLCMCKMFFCTILCHHCMTVTWKYLNFMCLLYGVGIQNTKKFDAGHSDTTPDVNTNSNNSSKI